MAKKVTKETAVEKATATPGPDMTTDPVTSQAPGTSDQPAAPPAVKSTTSAIPFQAIDITSGNLPDLADAEEVPFDLMADYWTPENKGEFKKVYFDCIKVRPVRDQEDPEAVIDLPCAFFFEKDANGIRSISNGSKRLVGVIEAYAIPRGTPLLITYLSKKDNNTNDFQSDRWSVKPLILKVREAGYESYRYSAGS